MSVQNSLRCLCVALAVLLVSIQPSVKAVDFHAFEFNESLGTELDSASNTGSPGGASWSISNNLTDSFTNGAGSFRIAKFNDLSADNYLQIDNITSATVGSRYIVARMSGWDFYDNVVGLGEGFWLAFLDDDSGTSGSSVTAQVLIDRNTTTEAIELRGSAIGVGSANVTSRATLNTTQSQPFTMVLELDKTSNTYKVFYKDGNNPSQLLGMAPIATARNGNSIRMAVRNNFGSTIDEFLAVDRIALTDTNPLTDLMTLEVDRITGEMKLINTTGIALSGLRSYSITSAAGALNPTNWRSVTDFYDQAPGNGSVDPNGEWSKTSTTTSNLSEGVVGGDGGNLAINQEVILSMGTGPWVQGIYEDLEITLNFDGGITRKANVNFVGNGGKRFTVGDLNFDGQFTAADWTAFNAGGEVDLDTLSSAQQYAAGDLNNDGANDIFDFAIFKSAYEAANGLGSFDAMLASVPEPTSLLLVSLASLAFLGRRNSFRLIAALKETPMISRHLAWLFALTFLVCGTGSVTAAILEDFQFNDAPGTTLANVANTGTGTGNMWNEDTVDMDNSAVQNGVFRIQKSSAITPDGFGTNYLDIANVTTGKVWLVAEMAGWHFASGTTDPNDFNAGQLEEIRFDFLNNDGDNQGGSTVTAEVEIERVATGGIVIRGAALGTGAGSIAPQPLSLSQSDPFTVVLALDKTNNNYEVFTKNGDGPFTTLGGPAAIDSSRNGNSIRFVANNSFAGAGEFFDINRIYLTDTDPTNISNDRLTLQVNTVTGEIKLRNTSSTTFDIDAYTITSSTLAGDLNLAGWDSLSDKVPLFDPVDGPDADSILGNGVGETWDEAPGSSNKVLAERFLLGSSVFPNGREVSLGNAFKVGGDTNSLTFQYRNADTGAIVTGDFEFVTTGPNGDYDNDGDVDGRDFLIWQRGGSPNSLSSGDLAAWQANYGTGSIAAANVAVPEPSSWMLFSLVAVGGKLVRRR
jgi:hypothetical protein